MRASRRFEAVLFGASGFTGRLVAEYLATHATDLRWALAGRSQARLETVRAALGRQAPPLLSLPILVADNGEPASLDRLAASAAVVCSTVGPYRQQGRALVSACASHGTDYCDLTGEVPFVRASIDDNDAVARRTGARVVHCCGFDSIPSDLGTWMLADHLRARGHRLAFAALFCGPMSGQLSGGTIATLLNLAEAERSEPDIRALVEDPYALLPNRLDGRGSDGPDQRAVRFDPAIGEWTGPFVMAGINTRVVRRSSALAGGYGAGFSYREAMSYGRGPGGFIRASLGTAALGAFVIGARSAAGRSMLRRVSPAPGEGPSSAQREAGSFRVRIVGVSEPPAGTAAIRAMATVAGSSDPGYGETAKMLGESILCLVRDQLPAAAGVLTPSSAMGQSLVGRLRRAGLTLSVADRP